MNLYQKLMVGFGSLWGLFLVATVLTASNLQRNSAELEAAFHSNFDSVLYCDRIKAAYDVVNRSTLVSISDGSATSQPVLQSNWSDYETGKKGQSSNITLPGEKELTEKAFQAGDFYRAKVDEFFSARADGREEIFRRTLLPAYFAASESIEAVLDLNLQHLITVERQLRENVEAVRRVQILLVILGGGLAATSVFVLAKTIIGPLQVLTRSARQIEGGNLDLAVPIAKSDEIGELASAFNAMAEKLREYRRVDHARLLRTQQTTQLAIDSLPDAVAVFNPSGAVEISNEQARKHFGMEPGRQQSEIRLEWLSRLFSETLATRLPVEPQGYHSAVQLFDGEGERFLLPRAVPMFGEQLQIIGVVVILVDVTRLHRADELKSGLVATISHELKTPLAATRFSVHLLAKESVSPLNDRQRQLVRAACDGADRLHRIIDNLLHFQRVEEGQATIRAVSVAASDLVSQVLDPLREDFEKAGLALKLDVPSDMPAVRADPDLIGYVLSNLLSNALKFVQRGGEIGISARSDAQQVRFSVTDNGPGIDAAHLPKVFERFYRAGAPASTPGVGLGLSIAKQLVEVHGGTIAVGKNEGGGMNFTFTLPIFDAKSIKSD